MTLASLQSAIQAREPGPCALATCRADEFRTWRVERLAQGAGS